MLLRVDGRLLVFAGVAAAACAALLRSRRRAVAATEDKDAAQQREQNAVQAAAQLSPRVRVDSSKYAVNPMSVVEERVVIAMVGLPARGKSYTSKVIIKYLNFLGCPVRLFNAGDKRRDHGLAGKGSSFFDSSNKNAKAQREQIAMETLDELLDWLRSAPPGCACGIFDATNTTVARRRAVIARCARAERASTSPLRLVFVENICNDERILEHSYQLKLRNDDYRGADAEQARASPGRGMPRPGHGHGRYMADAEQAHVWQSPRRLARRRVWPPCDRCVTAR